MGTIQSEPFGTTSAGESVFRYTLTNQNGMRIRVLNYGCVIQSIVVPDQRGNAVDVVLGYDDLAGYETGSCYFGAMIGRYANRIKGAGFQLNGKTYTLEKNDGRNHLHGVYCRRVFDCAAEGDTLVLRRVSPNGEEGYPGELTVEVRYTLREDDALVIEYRAKSNAETVVNLTNHSYFNLNGTGDVLGHKLTLASSRFTEGDDETLPTGKILEVDGTPMDFRSGKTIGRDIASGFQQIALCRGYDHNYILDTGGSLLRPFAEATGDQSGITLKAYTTQPAVQLYTGNYVDDDTAANGKNGVRYPRHAGFCLETQHYPCSPNYPQFPSTVLRPGEEYREITVYRLVR